ncbi:DUF1016 N-terminal domain-containing protein [Streptomyces sp. NPDC050659]|uniref:DUF1016 N-terminal domain-containing protein n=1 Tax=Streptomyces sp. NPDC050659 TaxID=3157215 RepID=UPI00344470FD
MNTELVQMHWQIGKLILARQEQESWGTKDVSRLAADLKATIPNQRGFSRSNLMYMHKMARTWLDFYATEAVRNGWSRVLLDRATTRQPYSCRSAPATTPWP